MNSELRAILVIAFVSFFIGYIFGWASPNEPTRKQQECDFCHKITKNGVRKPVTDLIYGKIKYRKRRGYETRLAQYCPICGRPLNQVADEDEDEDEL